MLALKEVHGISKHRFIQAGDPDLKISHIKPFISTPPAPFQINLYNKKAVMVMYGPNPTTMVFEEPQVYHGFKEYFDEFWNKVK
jgi:hypothetical protein